MVPVKYADLKHKLNSNKELSDKEAKQVKADIDKIINIIKKDLKIKEKNSLEKVKETNKCYDEIIKLNRHKESADRKNKNYNDNRLDNVRKFLAKHLIPSKLQLSKAKSQLFKMFTVGIFGELLQYYFVDPSKNYFTSMWFLKTFATAFGFIINDLFTVRTAGKINKNITFPLFKNNKKTLDWNSNLVNNIIKFSTHSIVMALFMYVAAGKRKSVFKIFRGISIAVIGSILYDFFMGDILQIRDPKEKEYIRHTEYFKRTNAFNKVISSTFKVAISIVGMDIAADGDLDTVSLIKFLVTMFALPLYFFNIEPHIMNECGLLH